MSSNGRRGSMGSRTTKLIHTGSWIGHSIMFRASVARQSQKGSSKTRLCRRESQCPIQKPSLSQWILLAYSPSMSPSFPMSISKASAHSQLQSSNQRSTTTLPLRSFRKWSKLTLTLRNWMRDATSPGVIKNCKSNSRKNSRKLNNSLLPKKLPISIHKMSLASFQLNYKSLLLPFLFFPQIVTLKTQKDVACNFERESSLSKLRMLTLKWSKERHADAKAQRCIRVFKSLLLKRSQRLNITWASRSATSHCRSMLSHKSWLFWSRRWSRSTTSTTGKEENRSRLQWLRSGCWRMLEASAVNTWCSWALERWRWWGLWSWCWTIPWSLSSTWRISTKFDHHHSYRPYINHSLISFLSLFICYSIFLFFVFFFLLLFILFFLLLFVVFF